jgi:glyoxylase-like metal-dependent hydrolase (beta-lactamase superfamily II)
LETLQIFPLVEGTFTIGHDKLFRPFDLEHDVLEDRPTGSLLVEVQPFLIKLFDEYILLDTGLGFNLPNGKLCIYDNLAKLGISPTQISKVILSHLHKDHAGGISYVDNFRNRHLCFPNATYYIYKPEFDYALENPGASYLVDEFQFLANKKDNVVFYEEENGILANGITHEKSGGHCAHHQVITITDGVKTIFFGGDEASQLKQLKIRYIAKYDFNGKLAADLREKYAALGKEKNYTFLFYHDVKLPMSAL